MNSQDPHHQIGELLRSNKPVPMPSPGLENRILRSLGERPRQVRVGWMAWFILPPAAAMIWMIFPSQPLPPLPAASAQVLPAPTVSDFALPASARALEKLNPLQTETDALREDAGRAGRFLIECLPAFETAKN